VRAFRVFGHAASNPRPPRGPELASAGSRPPHRRSSPNPRCGSAPCQPDPPSARSL